MAFPLLSRRNPPVPRPPLSRPRVIAAWIVALSADLVQITLAPILGPGMISFIDDVLDVFVAMVLTLLLGWHWEFLPGFIVKLIPLVDLVPTWSLACWLATRGRTRTSATEVHTSLPSETPPAPPVSGGRP